MNVQYTAGQTWPVNYSINWSSASSIPSVAQIVDGHWTLSGGTIYPTYLGYDRLVGIGNSNWTDYEVTVPITIHSIDSSGFNGISRGPGIGLLFRWTGHTDNPISGWQPKTGYLPFGAIGWYNWDDDRILVRLKLVGNNLNSIQEDWSGFMLTFGVTYIFKMRVETIVGQGGMYKFKVWQAGTSEPSTWLQGMQSLSDPQNGSLCLLAHHVNADFGDVTITPPGNVPIQLASFTATLQSNNLVRLNWTTITETNNYGFEVQKSLGGTLDFQTIPGSFIPGHGTTLEPHHYSYVDLTTSPGNWYYRLKQIDLDGTINYTEPVQVTVVTGVDEKPMPTAFVLDQNYPNPFNPTTHFGFRIVDFGLVTLKVFDVLGREVATVINKEMRPGNYDVEFNANELSGGVYLYTLESGSNIASKKLVLLK